MMKLKRTEGEFPGFDKKPLYFQTWIPENPKGAILLTHGFAEHSGSYAHVVESLNEKLALTVYAWDLRGHGKSEGKRGVIHSFSEYTQDMQNFYQLVKHDTKELPLFLMAHSLGGLVTTEFLLTASIKVEIAALILSSPFFGVAVQIPAWKEKLAQFLNQALPDLTMHNELTYSDLTHDEAIYKSYEKDPLRHDRISSRLFYEMQNAFAHAKQNASQIQWPLLMQRSGQDKIVDMRAADDFYDHVGSLKKERIVYEDMYHEIYNEIGRDQVFNDLIEYVKKYI